MSVITTTAIKAQGVSLALTPPPFAGSALRGALGMALKEVVCVNPKRLCQGCFASANCLYHEFFERDNHTPNYRLDIELFPKHFDFTILLFGEATRHAPYVVAAISKMIEECGIGANRVRGTIKSIACDGPKVWQEKPYAPNVLIELVTPLRIKHNNLFVRDEIDWHGFVTSMARRLGEVQGTPTHKLSFEPSLARLEQHVRFEDFARFSNRQKTKMLFGGLLGTIRAYGIDAESYRLLRLAELIGVGKSTVFGLGKIRVTPLAEEGE